MTVTPKYETVIRGHAVELFYTTRVAAAVGERAVMQGQGRMLKNLRRVKRVSKLRRRLWCWLRRRCSLCDGKLPARNPLDFYSMGPFCRSCNKRYSHGLFVRRGQHGDTAHGDGEDKPNLPCAFLILGTSNYAHPCSVHNMPVKEPTPVACQHEFMSSDSVLLVCKKCGIDYLV